MTSIQLTRPDDWHIHLRDGAALQRTVDDASRVFGRVIVMPNLTPPVRTVAEAAAYRGRIVNALPADRPHFQPLMVLYLTDNTTAQDIAEAATSDIVYAAKLYPAGATTNSDAGVTDLAGLAPVLAAMEKHELPLLVHGEVTDPGIDIFDREAAFIDSHLQGMIRQFPGLRVVLEHITTADAVDFVGDAGPNIAATITAHHLLHDRNDMLVGGIRPHLYCLPILKRRRHRERLLAAATCGNPKFFLGTDSAPHPVNSKESACGCAGCYTANAAIELYARAFESADALDKLEAFASFFGADFYRLPRNTDTITLQRKPWQCPDSLPMGDGALRPLHAGETLEWQVA